MRTQTRWLTLGAALILWMVSTGPAAADRFAQLPADHHAHYLVIIQLRSRVGSNRFSIP